MGVLVPANPNSLLKNASAKERQTIKMIQFDGITLQRISK